MDIIIQEIVEKIIKNYTKLLKESINGGKDISELILGIQALLDEIGVDLTRYILEIVDDIVRESEDRKRKYYIERRDDKKTFITPFGDVIYKRTYYKNKENGDYAYLSDEHLGIEPYDRMDLSFKAGLIEKASDLSYRKSGKSVSKNTQVTDQTVMNTIRELGKIENNSIEIQENKKNIDIIFIEADEDHVSMQDGSNKEIKLIYVHEGRRWVSKNRYELMNPRYFTGEYRNSEELWLEVADYIDEAYEMDKVKKIYLSGDGAHWIKEGLNWINGSQYVLDYFHLSKYVRIATAHMKPFYHVYLWKYINDLNQKAVKDILNLIIEQTESQTKQDAVKASKRYIMRNWEGIIRRYDDEYVGCSAEGHVSHILSDRLSSRPLGWCLTGADQMARLRVYIKNGGNIYELMKNKKKDRIKEERIIKLDKQVIKNRIKTSFHGNLNNIPAIELGKRTWQRQILRSARGTQVTF